MNRRLLVVDDDPDFLDLVRGEMTTRGWKVDTELSARRGMRRALGRRPDVILLDFDMPGETGLDFLVRLRSLSQVREIPVILVTAHHETELRIRGFESGLDDCLWKPFSFRELAARIDSVLRRSAARPDPFAGSGADALDDFLNGKEEAGRTTGMSSLWVVEAPGLGNLDQSSWPDGSGRYRKAMDLVMHTFLNAARISFPDAAACRTDDARLLAFFRGRLPAGSGRSFVRRIAAARRYTSRGRPETYLVRTGRGDMEQRSFQDLRLVEILFSGKVSLQTMLAALEFESSNLPVVRMEI